MERILAPRNSGRTYAICEYAVKNNCNILVPMGGTAILCAQDYIKEIARNLDIQYYGYRVDHQCLIVDLQSRARGEYSIHVITTTCPPDNYRGLHMIQSRLRLHRQLRLKKCSGMNVCVTAWYNRGANNG